MSLLSLITDIIADQAEGLIDIDQDGPDQAACEALAFEIVTRANKEGWIKYPSEANLPKEVNDIINIVREIEALPIWSADNLTGLLIRLHEALKAFDEKEKRNELPTSTSLC